MIFRTRQNQNFEALIYPHADKLYHLSLKLAGNRADAEDLIQDVLIKAYKHLPALDASRNIGGWLNSVLYNLFIDSRRQLQQSAKIFELNTAFGETSLPDIHAGEGSCPQALALAGEKQILLKTALHYLSPEFRAVVVLHDIEGFGLPELEEITQTPIGTLKSRLHRARRQLREHLVKTGYFDDQFEHKVTS